MALTDLMQETADPVYYSEQFRLVVEDHIGYLFNHPETTINSILAMDLVVFEFDFYGMLKSMGIPAELHYATLRMAKLTSPQDPFKHLEFIRVPPKGLVGKIVQRYQAQSGV